MLACILSKLTSDGIHSVHWKQPPGKSTSCQVVGAGNNCKFTGTTEIQSLNLYIDLNTKPGKKPTKFIHSK